MPGISIQFHMLLEELVDFVASVSTQYALSVELERWHPKVSYQVPVGADMGAAIRVFGQVDRVWLLHRPRGSRKAERFMVNVGTMRGNRLQQGAFGADTKNSEAMQVLKEVAAELRRRTMPGVWVTAETGDVGFERMFRISPGAARASRAGEIVLVNVAFTQSISPDPPG